MSAFPAGFFSIKGRKGEKRYGMTCSAAFRQQQLLWIYAYAEIKIKENYEGNFATRKGRPYFWHFVLRVTKIIFWLILKKRVIYSCPPPFSQHLKQCNFLSLLFVWGAANFPICRRISFLEITTLIIEKERRKFGISVHFPKEAFFFVRQIVGWPLVKIFSPKKKKKDHYYCHDVLAVGIWAYQMAKNIHVLHHQATKYLSHLSFTLLFYFYVFFFL